MIKVVIDSNVFISAFYLPGSAPAEVVFLARKRRICNFVSPPVIGEIKRILKGKLKWSDSRARGAVKRVKKFSEEIYPEKRLKAISDDPDNRILECAVSGQAGYIISGDRHLLNLKKYRGIRIVTPSDFLDAIR